MDVNTERSAVSELKYEIMTGYQRKIYNQTKIAVWPEYHYLTASIIDERNTMSKSREEQPIQIKCPNCKQTREPDFNETTRRYVCSVCNEPVDVQVIIEKKKRGLR
jgi:protein-arginine kinase activator protein McsA